MIWALGAIVVVGWLIWSNLPRETVQTDIAFDKSQLAGGVTPYFTAQEAKVPGVVAGAEKHMVWAGAPETRTQWAIVYVHGFSATCQEVRPLPDLVAQGLEANLVYTRLMGHGCGEAAMGRATATGWMHDVAEALAVAHQIGDRVGVISNSTGGTLTALAIHEAMGQGIAGAVFISPNFRLKAKYGAILGWPGARWWLPVLAGSERSFEPRAPDHARFWTTRYPMVSVVPMGAAVRAVQSLRHAAAKVPALFVFDDRDQIVDHTMTREIAGQWGARSDIVAVEVGERDDPGRHVIAGDILSPDMTQPMAQDILEWFKSLPGGTHGTTD